MALRAGISLIALVFVLGGGARAEAPASLASALLPADVLTALGKTPPDLAKVFCPIPSAEIDGLRSIEPVVKIEGFTSRMYDVADTLPGVRVSEKFVGTFGAAAVGALVQRDDKTKGELLTLLAKWASAGAFLQSASCVQKDGNLISTGKCAEWRTPDGSDLSSMKDATFSTFLAIGLVRAYYVALADSHPEMESEHKAIKQWVASVALRLKKPTKVYFGLNMGWYWPAITYDLAAGRTKQATAKLGALEKGMIGLIHDDGSIEDRTTRGDRAIWYHFTSIGEIVDSMELMRAAGVPISPKLETKLHAAVDVFLAAIEDETTIYKWAKQAHHFVFTGKQIWEKYSWMNSDTGGSWLHIYPYRYPDREASAKLRKLVPATARSATKDLDIGFGIGCVYNAAAKGLVSP